MREAIGGSWIYYLIVTFLLIYVFFMSFIMNYASSYRAANYVVTQIEQCQAQNNGDCEGKSQKEILDNIRTMYHYVSTKEKLDISCKNFGNGSIYTVNLPVAFDVPLIGNVGLIPVKAQTKTIQNISCSESGFN